ncbi:MAG: A24 family peptidase [Clostridia bacterium]|nr:A24 family peptidase [Clostridia bacterium]MDD4375190.1 A24 family peptidase [Clostridia bacterium]
MEYIAYIITTMLAIILGQVTKHLCKKMPPWVSEEISFKEYIKSLKTDFKIDIKYTIIYLILFQGLNFAIGTGYQAYLYMICIFSLALVFSIDYRYTLIPDESHIIIAVIGVVNLLFNLSDLSLFVLGAVVGGGSFYALGVLALLIYKKEGMGFGDVKLMAALGFLFGLKIILVITILSFAIAAVISIILIILKKKSVDSYIPFGPFIVIAVILIMFFGEQTFISIYYNFCMWLGTGITDVIFKLINN